MIPPILRNESREKSDCIEVCFGFGDGYDFGATAGTHEVFSESVSDEAVSGVAVEADVGEVGSES